MPGNESDRPAASLRRWSGLAASMIGLVLAQPAVAAPDAGCLAAAGPLVTLAPRGASLAATIAPAHGGELIALSWRGKAERRELLYRGGDLCARSGWEGKAPVLWPATGRSYAIDPASLPAGTPAYAASGWMRDGRRLAMPIHGFARTSAWHLDRVDRDRDTASAVVTLRDTAASRVVYPFGFALTITYTVRGDTLTIAHRVIAARGNASAMPFSIGNHITFDLAALGGAAAVRLSTPASLRIVTDRFGRPTGTTPVAAMVDASLSTLGAGVATSLGGYARGDVTARLSTPGGPTIRLTQSDIASPRADAIRYNLWGDPAAGYFAVEPWYGRQNALGSGEGIVTLPPGSRFDWVFTVAIGR